MKTSALLAETGKAGEKNEQKGMKEGTPDKAGRCGEENLGDGHLRLMVSGGHLKSGRERQGSHHHRLILDYRDTEHQH